MSLGVARRRSGTDAMSTLSVLRRRREQRNSNQLVPPLADAAAVSFRKFTSSDSVERSAYPAVEERSGLRREESWVKADG